MATTLSEARDLYRKHYDECGGLLLIVDHKTGFEENTDTT